MGKLKKPMDAADRHESRDRLMAQMATGSITLGQAIRTMRKEWAGVNQETLAKMCGVSLNTLSDIERDNGNATIKTLNRVLRAFGMEVGIRPRVNTQLTQTSKPSSHTA